MGSRQSGGMTCSHTTGPLGIVLRRAWRAAERRCDQVLREAGFSGPRWAILRTLHDRQAETQKQLAEMVGRRGATLTHHLDAMKADGLVLRTRNRDDHRPQGNRRGCDALIHMVKAYDAMLRRAVGMDAARFREVLGRILAVVGDD
jgi:MarR family transcriptional regulator for hemolysin